MDFIGFISIVALAATGFVLTVLVSSGSLIHFHDVRDQKPIVINDVVYICKPIKLEKNQ
jgi:hypothetical protein